MIKRSIGFELSGVYYIALDDNHTLAIYGNETESIVIHKCPAHTYKEVLGRYAEPKSIYIEE